MNIDFIDLFRVDAIKKKLQLPVAFFLLIEQCMVGTIDARGKRIRLSCPADDAQEQSYNGQYQQYVDEALCAINKHSQQPSDDQYDSDDVQYASHNFKFLKLIVYF